MHAVDQKALNDAAWKACDTFRGVVDPAQYKDYILIFLFWKYVSDLWLDHKRAFEREFAGDAERVARKLRFERFNLTEETTFQAVYRQRNADNVGELINIALQAIEEANRGKLTGVLTNIDFNSTNNLGETADRNRRLKHLFDDFARPELDFSPSRFNGEHRAEDAIGETYIYLISQFASDAGKKAGEFFTPRRVSELLVRLADPQPGSRICDPACGSSTLLIRAAEHIAQQQGVETQRADVKLFGQEATRQTQGLARMNMFLHGLDDARIEWGDTLNNPKLVEGDAIMRFDLVVANPPFSLDKWGAENAASDRWRRFHRGVPPKGRGDYAFISHMVEAAKPREGRVAVVMPHAVLWRGGAEGRIRQKLLEENLIDGIISLPEQLFPSTDTGVVLVIMDRAREPGGAREQAADVMFIDASQDYEFGKLQNYLSDEHLDRILRTWSARRDEERYARRVDMEEIERNGFNLNIWKYVDTVPPETISSLVDVEETTVSARERLAAIQEQIAKRNSPEATLTEADYAFFPLRSLLKVRLDVSTGNEAVHSVSVKKGLVDQVEHLGRSMSAADTSRYRLVRPGDVVYTKSPTGEFPLGIVRQSQLDQDAIVSPLYAVYEPISPDIGFLVDRYFSSPHRALKYMRPIVHKGAKNTISVSDSEFLAGSIALPVTAEGQDYLASTLRLFMEEGRLQEQLAKLALERAYVQSAIAFAHSGASDPLAEAAE